MTLNRKTSSTTFCKRQHLLPVDHTRLFRNNIDRSSCSSVAIFGCYGNAACRKVLGAARLFSPTRKTQRSSQERFSFSTWRLFASPTQQTAAAGSTIQAGIELLGLGGKAFRKCPTDGRTGLAHDHDPPVAVTGRGREIEVVEMEKTGRTATDLNGVGPKRNRENENLSNRSRSTERRYDAMFTYTYLLGGARMDVFCVHSRHVRCFYEYFTTMVGIIELKNFLEGERHQLSCRFIHGKLLALHLFFSMLKVIWNTVLWKT